MEHRTLWAALHRVLRRLPFIARYHVARQAWIGVVELFEGIALWWWWWQG